METFFSPRTLAPLNSMSVVVLLISILIGGPGSTCVCHAEEFANLVPNPGFEEDADLDKVPDSWEQVDAPYGRRTFGWLDQGRSGRAVSVKGEGLGGWRTDVSGVTPGRYYLFSFWVKREGFVDGEYPAVNVLDQRIYLNELFSYGGWVKDSWFLKAGQSETTSLKLLGNGMRHRVWFDDLELRRFDVRLVEPLNGSIVTTQQPRFSWSLPITDHVLEVRLRLSKSKEFGQAIEERYASPMGSALRIGSLLEEGKWYWQVSVRKNREEVGRSAVGFFSIEAEGETLEAGVPTEARPLQSEPIWGKPFDRYYRPENEFFFPIGIYSAPTEAFSELVDSGFNCVVWGSRDPALIREYVESAQRSGLRALVRMPRFRTPREGAAFLEDMADEEGVLGWYLEDEPEGRGVPPAFLWRLNRFLHLFDPNHPSALTLVRSKKSWDYGPAVDVLMVDPYPIPKVPVTWLSESIDEARRAVFHEKPVWAVVQAFDWAYFSEVHRRDGSGRNPTYEEERCLTYLAIVHGARGILYYTFRGGRYRIKEHPQHWEEVKKVVRELNDVLPLLVAWPVEEDIEVFVSSPDRVSELVGEGDCPIHYVVKEVGPSHIPAGSAIQPGRYLIAVNTENKPLQVTFVFDGVGAVGTLLSQRSLPLSDNRLTDYFGPYDVKLFALLGNEDQ